MCTHACLWQIFAGFVQGIGDTRAHPECAAGFLYDVDGFKVGTALEAQHSIHRQLSKVIFIMRQDFRAECCPCNIQEILRGQRNNLDQDLMLFGIAALPLAAVLDSL